MINFTKSWLSDTGKNGIYIANTWLKRERRIILNNSVIATNINILRRDAPYAYLFRANGYADEIEIAIVNEDLNYGSSVKTISFSPGVYLYPQFLEPAGITTIFEIGCRDVYPFVYYLGYDSVSLLCLKEYQSLEQIKTTVTKSLETGADPIAELVSEEGCLITNVDQAAFTVLTRCALFRRHFLGHLDDDLPSKEEYEK